MKNLEVLLLLLILGGCASVHEMTEPENTKRLQVLQIREPTLLARRETNFVVRCVGEPLVCTPIGTLVATLPTGSERYRTEWDDGSSTTVLEDDDGALLGVFCREKHVCIGLRPTSEEIVLLPEILWQQLVVAMGEMRYEAADVAHHMQHLYFEHLADLGVLKK